MKPVVTESTLVQQRAQGLALIAPLKGRVTAIIIKTPDDYAKADEALYQIRQAKQNWQGRLNPIIEPIRAGLDLLYGLRKDILDPLEELEGMVKERMRAFKLMEVRKLREAEEARQAEEDRLQAELDAKEKAEARAKTPAMTTKILEAKAKLQQALADKQMETRPEPLKVAGSNARTIKKWQVTDMAAFIKYLASQPQLSSLIEVDSVQMNAYYKLEQPKVGKWLPGIDIVEDINIAGRRS